MTTGNEYLADLLFGAHVMGNMTTKPHKNELFARLDLKIIKREELNAEEMAVLLKIAEISRGDNSLDRAIKTKELLCEMHRVQSALNTLLPDQPRPEP